jgi:hypothetical protein
MEAREALLAQVSTADGATEIKDPATGEGLGRHTFGTPEDVTVWVNGHGGIHPMIPFAGAKHSGYGLEFGVDGLKSVSVPQVISG